MLRVPPPGFRHHKTKRIDFYVFFPKPVKNFEEKKYFSDFQVFRFFLLLKCKKIQNNEQKKVQKFETKVKACKKSGIKSGKNV